MLRSDPSTDTGPRTWAQTAGINFGRIAMRHGVIVLNDPNGLAGAMNKIYFQLFPEEVRPRTVISRDRDEIKTFIQEEGGHAVLKPLLGSGGANVFLVRLDDRPNLNQMIEAVSREGYVIAQGIFTGGERGGYAPVSHERPALFDIKVNTRLSGESGRVMTCGAISMPEEKKRRPSLTTRI